MYPDLQALLQNSSSTRRYFVQLPVSLQLQLHAANEHIHTAEQLHRLADCEAQRRRIDAQAPFC